MRVIRPTIAVLLLAGCGVVQPPAPIQATAPPAPPAAGAPKPLPAAPKPSSQPPAPPKVAAAKPAPPAAQPPVAAKPPPLDLRTLEQRLKETSAIGVLTKLSLKNQVDDLVARFKAFHDGSRPPTLAELRPAFELLLMKVLSLLQDKDAALARDIDASRNAIWGVLADRNKLANHL